jgi:4-amino-4-deoxy-L-arabinose transferase-like glycosyltransferase
MKKHLFSNRIELFLFILLLIAYSYVWHKPSWNDLGRYDLMMAIVDHGTVSIDAYEQNTGDKAIFNSHYFSDKGPAPAFLGVPFYWMLNQLQALLGLTEVEHILSLILWFAKLVIIRIIIVSLPSALLAVILYRLLGSVIKDRKYALILTLAYSLGTMAFPYSTLFYGHQLAAAFIFFAFYILYQSKKKIAMNEIQFHPKYFFFSGLFIGLAIMTEYPVILLAIVIIIYAIFIINNQKKFTATIIYYCVGLGIPLIILLYYNYLCSGNPFRFGYFQVAGEEFRQEMAKGIAGVTYPKLGALFGITFSPYRGLFIVNPILLLAFPGFYYFYKNKTYRSEFWVCLFAVILFFLFNASYYMWWGGWTIGPRHLIPIIPFLIIAIAFIPFKKAIAKYSLYVLTIISILFMFIGTMIDPQVPDDIRRLFWSPIFEYSLPQLLSGNIYANLGTIIGLIGLTSVLPLLLIIIIGIYYLNLLQKKT